MSIRNPTRRGTAAWSAAVLLALTAACSGGSKHRVATAPTSTTDASAPASTAAAAATPAAGPATSAAKQAGAPTTGTRSGGTTTATAPIAPNPGGPAPVPTGTYTYSQKGSATFGTQQTQIPPTGTLVADPARPDGTQVTHRVVDPSQGSVDTTYSFAHGGMFLLSVTLHLGQSPVTCTFSAPLPAPPWPPAPGKAFSGNATCDFNGETASVSGTVGSATTAPVLKMGSRPVWHVDFTLTAQGPYQAKDVSQELFSPDLRLPVQTVDHVSGSFGVLAFTVDDQSQLVSGPG